MLSDIEIARSTQMRNVTDVAKDLGIPGDDLISYGRYKAKVPLHLLELASKRPQGKLVLVTGITPTPAGEGKSTVTVGLGDGLRRLGKHPMICLREPSLGPCFGIKGGAAGGGFSQVVPMEDINLHFTGDIHAVTSAHNLLAAMMDNHIQQGNALNLDVRRIQWRRVMDMNDRALRNITIGMGGPMHGVPRESGFDISVASEVMAVLCLSESLQELRERVGKIVVGETRGDRELVRASDLNAQGAMTVLLRDALAPNLVQTLEGTPAFVHGGPFANIAHGCNSVLATRMAMGLGDYVITEAGFGADLGAEKFFNIKCRKSGLVPDAVVIVATARALKMHGGIAAADLREENVEALTQGCENLRQHLENLKKFGVPVVVAYNRFTGDTEAEINTVREKCAEWDTPMALNEGWGKGGEGSMDLAKILIHTIENNPSNFKLLYEDDDSLLDKITTIATEIYRADGVDVSPVMLRNLKRIEDLGYGDLPVCMAKTQNSFSADPNLKGAPSGFRIPIREVRLAAGAGFVVVMTGDIMTMPGLPRKPSAEQIDINESGQVVGLF